MPSSDRRAGSASEAHAVAVNGVSHWYETKDVRVHALDEVDLRIDPGEFVCIVGASGCGKTTLLQMLAGFLVPTEGEITIGKDPITGPNRARGVVFQRPTLFPWLSVAQNVSFGPRMAGEKKESYSERVDNYLDMMGLSEFRDRAPYELSGGMQQRAAIARVLANDPEVILMDEPFGALDALTRETLQEELLRLWRTTHKSIMFITHSVEEAVFLGTRVVVMSPRPGRIVHQKDVRMDLAGDNGEPSFQVARANVEFNRARQEIDDYIHGLHV
ncbi:ABC transporter ATP-binding protein [Leekyejoonella antrihumi]|uniref:ABC transporter ATP-binding protein n=1 Tax=Leekyejoonella antrihumi TaxID=1660198 RepID=UPI001FE40A1B|nr:ABC transporter ATP-binding protein [Leekyejoonella antrihumi]